MGNLNLHLIVHFYVRNKCVAATVSHVEFVDGGQEIEKPKAFCTLSQY